MARKLTSRKTQINFTHFGALFLSFVLKIFYTFVTLSLVYLKRKENKEAAVVVWS